MICPVCSKAAEENRHGIEEHIGCPSIQVSVNPNLGNRRYKVDNTYCDCQHKFPVGENGE